MISSFAVSFRMMAFCSCWMVATIFFIFSSDVFAELLLQDVVIDVHGALNHIFHLTVFDFVLPFYGNFALHPAHGRFIRRRTDIVIIEQACYRRAPIINEMPLTLRIREGMDANIVGTFFFRFIRTEIHPAKIRRRGSLRIFCGLAAVFSPVSMDKEISTRLAARSAASNWAMLTHRYFLASMISL